MSKVSIAIFTALTMALAPHAFAQGSKKDKDASSDKQARKGDLAGDDLKYFRQMAQANLAEVEAGRMAENKASSGEVKKFARHMVEDHGQALSDARSLAKSKGVQAPDEPSKKSQEAAKKLQSASGEEFDKAFMKHMVNAHEDALKLHRSAAKNAKDKDVKAAAQKSVPVIEKHLEEAKRIAASLK